MQVLDVYVEEVRCQFHQHFMRAFLPIFWSQKISNPKHSFVIFGAKILYKKCVRKTLMKSTPGSVSLKEEILGQAQILLQIL